MRWVTVAVATAAGLLLVSACGDNGPKQLSHDDYVAAVNEVGVSPAAMDAEKRFFTLAAGTTQSDCVSGSKIFARDIHTIIAAVAALVPPDDVDDLQTRFLFDARQSAAKLDRLASDVARGRVVCGEGWNHRAYGLPSTLAAEKVLAEFTKRYKLPGGD